MDGMISAMLLKKYGTVMNNTLSIPIGDAPLKNWTGTCRDYNRSYYKNIDPDKILKRETRKYHCYSCVMGCGGICGIKDLSGGRFSHTHKPEYETVMAFGGLLMNKDLDSLFLINEILNRAGLDSISAGGAVAFAIECFERGVLTEKDTGGLKLAWGDAESILRLVDKMVRREGIGDILADGVQRAAEKIGKGSEEWAVHAGGQELPMHDPKIDPMMGTTYSTDPTPGRHTTSGGTYYSTSFLWNYVPWAPRLKKHPKTEDYEPTEIEALKNVAMTSWKMLIDGSGSCYYAMLTGLQHFRIFDYLNYAAGWKKTPEEYIETGKRIQTMRQMFNAKHGVNIKKFKMNPRASGNPPLSAGPSKGVSLKLDEMIAAYWKAWGWNSKTGYPLKETVNGLGLDLLDLEYNYE